MPNGVRIPANAVWTVEDDAGWLNPDGELPVCLAQPALVGKAVIAQDGPRPDSVSLASLIFGDEAGRPWLARWFGDGVSGMLVFPEYAFGSDNFASLHGMISAYPQPLVVLAGFGAVTGAKLRSLLELCEATWPGGAGWIDPQCSYNAGWCWVHHRPGNTVCHIFLKNFFDQRVEIALLNAPTPGNHILEIATRDLVFYPLICADLISNLANSPRVRIASALPRTSEGGPDANKRVLVVTLLYTDKPHHGLWRQAINDVVELHGRRTGLCLVNQLVPGFHPDADVDHWRCLSGGFIHQQIMAAGPRPPLPFVRYLRTDSASGLILRQPSVGVACGRFRWVHGADLGLNVWEPNVRRVPTGGALEQQHESVEFQELRRFVRRRRQNITERYHQSSEQLVGAGLDNLLTETTQEHITPRIWAKLLTGIEQPAPPFDADAMSEESGVLEPALGVFAALQQTTGATPLVGPPHRGQLRWGEWEILVWNSPRHDCLKMHEMLIRCALDRPHEPQLIVVAGGISGYLNASRIPPDHISDITESREAGAITESRFRHIDCRPLGQIEIPLLDPQMTLEQRRAAILRQLTVN